MSDKEIPNQNINVNIGGNLGGQMIIGDGNTQTQIIRQAAPGLTQDELQTLIGLMAGLKQQVAAQAPADKAAPAMEKVTELEQAITAKEPDLTTMEYVRNWFVKNIPQLAGAVTGLVVNPLVGKLVEAAGETIASEFKRRFGSQSSG